MKDIVKKAFLLGIGVVALTKEKAESFVKELKEEEKITPEEGKKLVNDMLKKSEEYGKKVRKEVRKQVEKVIDEMGVATKSDLEKLRKEIKG